MKRYPKTLTILTLTFMISIYGYISSAALRGGDNHDSENYDSAPSEEMMDESAAALDPETQELLRAKEALRMYDSPTTPQEPTQAPRKTFSKKDLERLRAESFVAGSDWEFDGFIAGGEGQEKKSMFVLNDLIYLNVGFLQGIEAGDMIGIFKRGGKIRDPQSGRFLGYEVRKAAVSRITSRINDETCSARIVKTFEFVEIGDLVRREP